MENSNRNDIHKFFTDMPPLAQKQAIFALQKIIKKPPDCTQEELQEVAPDEKSPA